LKNTAIYLFWLIVIGGVINYYIISSNVTPETRNQLQKAYAEYVKGETAAALGERQDAFNRALALYTSFESEYQPAFGNGKLYFNIANSYYQVSEYPWAILYYYRAHALMPRSKKVADNLEIALKKLRISPKEKKSVFNKIFFFHTDLSLPERLRAFFILSLFGILFSSLYIWKNKQWLKRGAILAAILSGVVLCSLGYSHYIAATEGVMVKSSALYRDAGPQYAKVVEEPILSGVKVEILDTAEGGKWLKIFTPEGILGYVPQESIRII
jgi:tetratricopeptide (TPR) repeat protein